MNIAEAKAIPIADYLQSIGITPCKRQGNSLWYYSPFRQETEASFKVNLVRNEWYDFGAGKGGDILKFVMERQGINDISQVLHLISGETFKASEFGKEFGLRSLFLHYGQNIDGKTTKPKHFDKKPFAPLQAQNQSTILETATGIIGGLLDIPAPTSDYDADEAALQRQTKTKKKKRRGIRW
jgi:hypothetical protein